MKTSLLRAFLTFILIGCAPMFKSQAQSAAAPIDPPVPTATFFFSDGASDKAKAGKGRFDRVGLYPREKIEIDLQYPVEFANTPISAQSLDGAELSLKSRDSVIGPDGKLSLRFKVEDEPGLYRIVVTVLGGETTLQFWVYDPEEAKENPAAANGR